MTKILASVVTSTLILVSATAPAAAEGDVALGQKAFQRCSACHSTTDQKKAGPGLGGVVGRAAGSIEGVIEGVRYSAAMKASGLVWDEATLDRFLAAPREVVPTTTMTAGVPNPEDRLNIIAYLKSLSE
ncbi:c-type cytochrome [Rhizobium laguerreae]|uniref:c-type cytochrome n=1 Tax=Rhizobium laguerreae TaxID=1076926 RepID=UPI001C92B291|nr:cytochrome c family protein [Rhizobium laguerreae]MBY3168462.1 cytochrome c family protein [Rhizobium laguerreae]